MSKKFKLKMKQFDRDRVRTHPNWPLGTTTEHIVVTADGRVTTAVWRGFNPRTDKPIMAFENKYGGVLTNVIAQMPLPTLDDIEIEEMP